MTRLYIPLRTSSVGTNDDGVFPSRNFLLDVCHDGRLGEEVIAWDVEEALDLGGVKVKGDDVIGSGDGKEICDQPASPSASWQILRMLRRLQRIRKPTWR